MANALRQHADELFASAATALANLRRREDQREVVREEPRQRSHAEELRWVLSGWATQAPEAFMDHLEQAILQHNAGATHEAMNHNSPNFELGAEHSLRVLRNEFLFWSGQSSTDDPEEVSNG